MTDLLSWLREQCGEYQFTLEGVFQRAGHQQVFPLTAANPNELAELLKSGGHILPLPKEPASLANLLEVSIVDFLIAWIDATDGAATYTRGSERGYPDIEISGDAFGGGFHAVDIKCAQRKVPKRGTPTKTQSAITLYTGNTYFANPTLHWPGTRRAFSDYRPGVDAVVQQTVFVTDDVAHHGRWSEFGKRAAAS